MTLGGLLIGGFYSLIDHRFFVPRKILGSPVEDSLQEEKVEYVLATSGSVLRVGTNYHRVFEVKSTWDPLKGEHILSIEWHEVAYNTRLEFSSSHSRCPFDFWAPPFLGRVVDRASIQGFRTYVEETLYCLFAPLRALAQDDNQLSR